MRKTLKILGILCASLLLLGAAGLFYLLVLFNPNHYKTYIAERVQTLTGRQLVINGDIKLKLFPWVGITVNDIQLNNPAGFEKPVFASLKSASMRMRTWPLLRGKVEAGVISVDGATVNLIKTKKGNNWSDLQSTQSPSDTQTPENNRNDSNTALTISGITLSNSSINWTDSTQHQAIHVSDLDMNIGTYRPGAAVNVDGSFAVNSNKPDLNGKTKFQSTVVITPAQSHIELNKLDIAAQLKSKQLANQTTTLHLQGRANYTPLSQSFDFSKITIKLADVTLTGTAKGEELSKNPKLYGNLNIDKFNPRNLANALNLKLFDAVNPNAVTTLSANGKYSLTSDSMELNSLSAKLDDSTLTGKLAVKNWQYPQIKFDLDADNIDLDRYLPQQKDSRHKKSSDSKKNADTTQATIDFDVSPYLQTLRNTNIDGRITVDKYKFNNIQFSNISIPISGNNGMFVLAPINANLYKGNFTGDVRLDFRKSPVTLTVNKAFTDIQAGSLLKDLIGVGEVTGVANITANVTSKGLTLHEVLSSLNGNIRYSFLNGSIKGINFIQLIRDASVLTNKSILPSQNAPNQTEFNNLTGTIVIRNGIGTNNDLLLRSPIFQVRGRGTLNFIKATLNYQLNGTIKGTSLVIPFTASGPINNPNFNIDTQALLQDQLNRQVDSLTDRIFDRDGDSPDDSQPANMFQQHLQRMFE